MQGELFRRTNGDSRNLDWMAQRLDGAETGWRKDWIAQRCEIFLMRARGTDYQSIRPRNGFKGQQLLYGYVACCCRLLTS
jgi:hypothetical protein